MSGRARASRAGHRSRGSSCLSPADFGAAIRELLGLRRRATRGCPHCSFWADDFNGIPVHLNHRDVSFVAISRAPLAKIERLRKRMGWSFRWVSSLENDFNHDLHVAFTPKELQSGTATVRHHDRYQD